MYSLKVYAADTTFAYVCVLYVLYINNLYKVNFGQTI